MTQFTFGSGTLILKRTDLANTPPALLGTLQDIGIDFDRKIEGLLGQYNVAVALGGGELKITGKAKYARMQATQYNNLFFGQPAANVTTPAMLEMTTGEAIPAPGATSFTVTNHASYVEDLGLFYTTSGVQLTPIPSGTPVSGQYVPGVANVGTYTVAAADDALAFTCFYSYTVTTAGSTKITLGNQLMGAIPTFEMTMKQSFNYFGTTKDLVLQLNACSSSKLSLPFSNQKFMISEFDFQAQADASNNVGTMSLSE